MRQTLFFILLVSLPTWVGAEIYKGTDANGNTVYSDQPMDNGEPVKLPPLPTYSPPPMKVIEEAPPPPKANVQYQISIMQPQNEQTFTTDISTIDIQLQVTPGLQENDKVQILLNGQPYGTPAKTLYFQVKDLPRGAYHLQAEILTGDNVVAKSDTITFFQQRASAKGPTGANLAPQALQAQRAPAGPPAY